MSCGGSEIGINNKRYQQIATIQLVSGPDNATIIWEMVGFVKKSST
jgi:hypothetical protein